MPRIITSFSIDLSMNALDSAQPAVVAFADVDGVGREKHGNVRLDDARALLDFPAFLAAVNAAIDVKATEVNDPAAITDRLTEAARLDALMRNRQAIADVAITKQATAEADERRARGAEAVAKQAEQEANARRNAVMQGIIDADLVLAKKREDIAKATAELATLAKE